MNDPTLADIWTRFAAASLNGMLGNPETDISDIRHWASTDADKMTAEFLERFEHGENPDGSRGWRMLGKTLA